MIKIYVIMKVYSGGRIELIEAYLREADAMFAASKILPMTDDIFSIILSPVNFINE